MWSELGAPIATKRVSAVTPTRASDASATPIQRASSSWEKTKTPGTPVVPAVEKTR
jgi:hypothetical protein